MLWLERRWQRMAAQNSAGDELPGDQPACGVVLINLPGCGLQQCQRSQVRRLSPWLALAGSLKTSTTRLCQHD